MTSKPRLLEIVDYLITTVNTLHELAMFAHSSEHIIETHGVGFAMLAHEAGCYLAEMRDRMTSFSKYLEVSARKRPEA
jgi:hypothetical protein